ncbi:MULTISPECIES: hypothetical protein [unclassified Rhizobium]|uniref:hypothetical protein n=1 Tax=unclassified Rhizobium TaxID=2613769 RepID=UPI001ADA768F|nr:MULTISPECIES: hypothetical protein [unclassified Rhizobium]MBO9127006.1 hypothetical protein [Rhizobium sp. 16-488-2b]MBO9177453.1 hypothetical protein [Rhizobium sp. 16-488-2a]
MIQIKEKDFKKKGRALDRKHDPKDWKSWPSRSGRDAAARSYLDYAEGEYDA